MTPARLQPFAGVRAADRLLLAADWATLMAGLCFATEALRSPRAPALVATLAIWAAVPYIVSRSVRAQGWPRRRDRGFLLAAGLAAAALTLGVAGWELLHGPIPEARPLFGGTALLMLLAWAAGFFLFVPQVYRVHDFLTTGVVLMALLERRPDGLPWASSFLLGIVLSTPLRHQLFDIFPRVRRPRVAVAGGGRTSLVFGTCGVLLYVGLALLLRPWLDREELGRRLAEGPALGAVPPEERDGLEDAEPARGGVETARTIGYPGQARLSDIAEYKGDPTVVLRIRDPLADPNSGLEPSSFPATRTLWRVLSQEHYDPANTLWFGDDDRPFERRPLEGPSGRLRRPSEAESLDDVEIELEIANVVRAPTAPLPYGWKLLERPGADPDEVAVLVSGHGDVVLRPRPREGDRIWLRVDPGRDQGRGLAGGPEPAEMVSDPAFLETPDDRELGFSLTGMTAPLARGTRSRAQRLRRFRDWFGDRFRYDARLDWAEGREGRELLAAFALEARRGDCMYLATLACLALRRLEIPARFVAGYAGSTWDPQSGAWLVREANAHAWVEILLLDGRWVPLDPTTWVPGGLDRGLLEADEIEDPAAGPLVLRTFPDLLVLALGGTLLLWVLLRRSPSRETAFAGAPTEDLAPHRDLGAPAHLPRRPTDVRTALLVEYDRLQRRLARRRLERRPHETPAEHAALFSDSPEELRQALDLLRDAVDRALYGALEPDPAELARVREASRTVRRHLR